MARKVCLLMGSKDERVNKVKREEMSEGWQVTGKGR